MKLLTEKKIIELKKQKKSVVLCHGVFDLIHIGHIEHFMQAKTHGDILVISLTSDKFVNKGPGRPFFSINQRLKFLSSLKVVDYVVESKSKTALNIIDFSVGKVCNEYVPGWNT